MHLRFLLPAAAVGCLVLLPGCARETLETPAAAPPVPVFQGPQELRGTIGSFARLQGGAPQLVSGYGLVVNLDNTGSAVVPEFLRGWLANEMRKRGVGSGEIAARNPELAAVTPQRLMLSTQTATVKVSGLIPPGATPGTPFDLFLEALPEDTDTTSLAGGQLWQTSLGVSGANRRLAFTTPLAIGQGPVYLGPETDGQAEPAFGSGSEDRPESPAGESPAAGAVISPVSASVPAPAAAAAAEGGRLAVIVGGGRATQARRLELVLHSPSWPNARRIADTINERYRAGGSRRVGAVRPTANAVSNAVIELNVPERFASNPEALLALIENTYPYPVERADTVDVMMDLLRRPEPGADLLRRVPLVCRALGPNALPALRLHYDDAHPRVRKAALDTGSWLADDNAVPGLLAMAAESDPAERRLAAEALSRLPDNLRATEGLRQLIDDDDESVRLAAYQAAAASGSPLIERLAVEDLDGLKFIIERVPSDKPLVLAVPQGIPRLVLFGLQSGFRPPVFDTDPRASLLIRTPTDFAQALNGLRDGDTAFLPAVARTSSRTGPSGPAAEALDATGGIVSLALGNGEAAAAFEELLPVANGGASGRPVTLRCRVVNADLEIFELLGVEPGLSSMPLSVFHRPDDGEPRIERVQPSVAALTWYLAHRPSMQSPQEGLNLSFSRSINVLDRLARGGFLEAPMRLLPNEIASEIAEAEREFEASRAGRELTSGSLPSGRLDTAGAPEADGAFDDAGALSPEAN